MLGLLRLAILYLIIVNLCTFVVFLWDKIRAKQGEWRVKESTLLLLAAIGGSPAVLFGRTLLRHKSRKGSFGRILLAIFILQIVIVAGVIVYRTTSQVW